MNNKKKITKTINDLLLALDKYNKRKHDLAKVELYADGSGFINFGGKGPKTQFSTIKECFQLLTDV